MSSEQHEGMRRREALVLLGGLAVGAAWNLACGSTPNASAGGAKARLKLHRRAKAKGYLGTAALGVRT